MWIVVGEGDGKGKDTLLMLICGGAAQTTETVVRSFLGQAFKGPFPPSRASFSARPRRSACL